MNCQEPAKAKIRTSLPRDTHLQDFDFNLTAMRADEYPNTFGEIGKDGSVHHRDI